MCAILALGQTLLHQGLFISTTRYSSTRTNFTPFASVERAKPTEASSLEQAFRQDTNSQKINLAGEVHRNSQGKPHVIQAVRKAGIGIAVDDSLSHEPQQLLGNPAFTRAASELILNKMSPALTQNRVLGIQTRSSLDALRLAATFLRQKMKCSVCLLANPSCELYERVFKSAGFTCQSYQYYNENKAELNIYGLVADLMSAPEGSVVLLDACAQNPTGLDPSNDEWKLFAHIIKCKKMMPVFHLDSPGLASGDATQDTWPVRYFVECGFDLFCAQSFVRNFGLYNETLGQLMVVLNNNTHLDLVREHFEVMLLENNEPCSATFASRVVAKILNSRELSHDWSVELKDMHRSVQEMRLVFINKLALLQTPGCWEQLKEQNGSHIYTSLQSAQLKELQAKHVYVPNSGRINVTALKPSNVDYVAGAINEVMLSHKSTTIQDHNTVIDAFQELKHIYVP